MKKIALTVLMIFLTASCLAQSSEIYKIQIKNHEFSPKELSIPADKKVKILVENLDPTPEEFESYDLNREKVVTGNDHITIFVGPLKAGVYKYFGDFNKNTAQGVIKVNES